MKYTKNHQAGFTLIELMVVISVISLLSSILTVSLTASRARAYDTKKIVEADSVRTAIHLYYGDNKAMPLMYDCTGPCVVKSDRATPEIEDTLNPGNPDEPGRAYNATMHDLVAGKYLADVPHSRNDPYTYYDYGSSSEYGAVFSTYLSNPNTTPVSTSCPVYGTNNLVCTSFDESAFGGSLDYQTNLEREDVTICYYPPSQFTCYFAFHHDGRLYQYGAINPDDEDKCLHPPPVIQGTNLYGVCVPY
jgi:prepilin-type N-terminal cleavage/methylation domain-containing protein